MELSFEKKFHILIKFMSLNKTHPYIPIDKKWALFFIVVHGIYTAVFSMLVYSIVVDVKISNYAPISKNGVGCLVYSINTFYCMIMLRYRNIYVDLIETMKKDYESKIPSNIEIMTKYANKGSKFCKLWVLLTICGGIWFPGSHIGTSIYYCVTDGCRLTYIFDITYPSPIDEYKYNIFVFIILNISHYHYFMCTVVYYVAFVPLEPVFMLHACGQFEIVKHRIDNLCKVSTEDDDQEKLKSIVLQLQSVYSFVENMKKCFIEANEVTIKITPFLLPITYYEFVKSYHRGEVSVGLMAIIIGAIIISSAWCYYSDLLMEKGEDVALAVYSCGWETRFDRRTRPTLLLVLLRAQAPVGMRAMFCTLCLETLTQIFRQSYAIFNVMNAVWNN